MKNSTGQSRYLRKILPNDTLKTTIVLHIRKTQFDLLISKPINKQINLLEKRNKTQFFSIYCKKHLMTYK